MVAEFFSSFGFPVEVTKGRGVDVSVDLGGYKLSVEVKAVHKKTRKNGSVKFYSPGLCSGRAGDDLIAFVFEDKIAIIPMAEHLKNGRNVTRLFESYVAAGCPPPSR